MPPRLVECYRRTPKQPIFLGTDGKNQTAVADLIGIGAVRFQPTGGSVLPLLL